MNAVIYARFSSHSQREQSIEGQLKTCYKFAADNGYTVIGEYIDRAQSGTNDNRAEFQRMIADSDKHTFNAVIVYQLDRFARNRYDSAINKAKLKKNGVRVVSARENITDDASGILVEGILESMAEYYSAELSQKIHRGMSLNAQKCLSNGSNPGLGFKVAPDHTFYVDDDEAVIVREIFERYGKGETVTDIIKDLNARQIKTSLGRDFNKNSLHRLLRNKRYIGTYLYKGEETPGGMPRIVSDEVFERVQNILDKNKAAPARSRGKEEYLLTTKLFCGYCLEMMTGYGGTGKSGKAYHYYACKNAKKHLCQKKVVDKKRIEDMVVAACRQMLTDSNIQRIAEAIEAVFKSEFDSSAIKRIKTAIQEADTAVEILWQALEKGQGVDTIMERINKRQEEKAELEAQLAIEAKKERVISAQEVTHFLSVLQKSNFDDPLNRRAVINIFLNKVYLYDDKFRLVLNGSGQPVEIDNIMLDEIDDYFDSQISNSAECSSMVADAPPNQHDGFDTKPSCFSIYVEIRITVRYNQFNKLEFDGGSKYMSKGTAKEKRIIALAYFHRYGWIAAMMVCIAIWSEQMLCILSVACLSISVWSFIGYKKKWKHIYCSFQNSYHQKMTPNNIQWHKIKKSDAYGVPLVFFIIGLALLAVMMWY